jgi:hypothetical protein
MDFSNIRLHEGATADRLLDCLDFNVVATNFYSNQDQHANVLVEDDGLTLALFDNTSGRPCRSYGCGEYCRSLIIAARARKCRASASTRKISTTLSGSSSCMAARTGREVTFQNLRGKTGHIVIPVGVFTGSNMRLVFSNDMDPVRAWATVFRNVRFLRGGQRIKPAITNWARRPQI